MKLIEQVDVIGSIGLIGLIRPICFWNRKGVTVTARGVRRLADWFYAAAKQQREDDLRQLLKDISLGLHALARLLDQRDAEI